MNNKRRWIYELIAIVAVISLALQVRFIIGAADFKNFIFGFAVNIAACSGILMYSICRIKLNRNLLNKLFEIKLSLKDVLVVLALIVLGGISFISLSEIEVIHFIKIRTLPPVQNLTGFQSQILFFLFLFFILIVVFSEELFFRLYLFKNQYVYFKNYTWIINGASWCIYHTFTPTNFIALLPLCLMYSYVYQKRRNIWITIAAHLINNLIVYLPLLKYFFKKF